MSSIHDVVVNLWLSNSNSWSRWANENHNHNHKSFIDPWGKSVSEPAAPVEGFQEKQEERIHVDIRDVIKSWYTEILQYFV